MIPQRAYNEASLRDMASLLRAGRRKVRLSFIANEALRGLAWGVTGVAVFAAVHLIVRIVAAFALVPVLPGFWGFAVASGGIVAVTLAICFVRALKHLPSDLATAERLDLATQSHNRVATAFWLASAGQASPGEGSPFVQAAIEDGLTHLRGVAGSRPRLIDLESASGRRIRSLVVATVAMVFVAMLLPVAARPPQGHDRPAVAANPSLAGRIAAMDGKRKQEPPASRPYQAPQKREATQAESKQAAAARDSSKHRPREATNGSASGSAVAKGQQPGIPSGAQGGSAGASSMSRSSKRPMRPSVRRPSKPVRVVSEEGYRADDSASATGQGSSGGGSMLAVHNPWSQRASASEGEVEEEDVEEELEEETEANTQRGGIQPSLKDRNESPGRELGISEGQGPPGSGRGGPTPPKKARGVASLVLGVPIPDFVKGRLAPGTTKITHERVEPSVMAGDSLEHVAPAPRSLSENPTRRFGVTQPVADFVRRYLIALHSADLEARIAAPVESSGRANEAEE